MDIYAIVTRCVQYGFSPMYLFLWNVWTVFLTHWTRKIPNENGLFFHKIKYSPRFSQNNRNEIKCIHWYVVQLKFKIRNYMNTNNEASTTHSSEKLHRTEENISILATKIAFTKFYFTIVGKTDSNVNTHIRAVYFVSKLLIGRNPFN